MMHLLPQQSGLPSIRYAPARSIQSVWMVTDFETNRARDVTMRRAWGRDGWDGAGVPARRPLCCSGDDSGLDAPNYQRLVFGTSGL